MTYNKIAEGIFISRPNRFIAKVLIEGKEETVHVKNTGRCRELLVPNAKVFLEDCENNTNRKTRYDLIAVEKGERLINMDSQAPNKAVYEFLQKNKFIEDLTYIKPEYTFGDSRIDFFCESKSHKYLIEVKGVTLEENGAVYFPDAPTERGIKHIKELQGAQKMGFVTYVFFVIQMDSVTFFSPNDKTHPAFGDALRNAAKDGVKPIAYCCDITKNSITITNQIPIIL